MKKVSLFVIIPTLLLATLSCTAMKPVSLTKSQQNKYLSDDWAFTLNQNSKAYSIILERPYSDSVIATLKYKPAKNNITLCYLDTHTRRTYANSSFALPENYKQASQLNFTFITNKKNKQKVIIALDDTYFTYPVPAEVIEQDNIKK